MGSRVRIRLFHILHFVMHFLFPLLKNSKSGVDGRGHRLRSGSPVTNLPGASSPFGCDFVTSLLFLLQRYKYGAKNIQETTFDSTSEMIQLQPIRKQKKQ